MNADDIDQAARAAAARLAAITKEKYHEAGHPAIFVKGSGWQEFLADCMSAAYVEGLLDGIRLADG